MPTTDTTNAPAADRWAGWLGPEDLAAIDRWGDVAQRARQIAGGTRDDTPHPYDYRLAAEFVLGFDEFAWSPEMRDALAQHGVELSCPACQGHGGACSCGSPHCLCPLCSVCNGSGVEVRP